jgi:hypothetical protein
VPQLFPCDRVGLEIFDGAPYFSRRSIDLPIAPHQLWEVLTDVEAWPKWSGIITKATWISPAPHRVGSTRSIDVVGGFSGTEEILVWSPPHHLAFRIIESSRQATGASAEEYRIETLEHGCRLTWTTARRPRVAPSWLARTLAKPLIARSSRRALKKLRKYTDQRYGPSIQYAG